MNQKGILTVISGPAGSGKGTVISTLMEKNPKFRYSVSATSREPRPGEINGVNYTFVTKEEFSEMITEGKFLEHAEYVGDYYGTPVDYIKENVDQGYNIILEIDLQGALQIKSKFREAVLIMLIPPSFKALEERLRGRGTESEDKILQRLARAKEEVGFFDSYDYVVINEDGKYEQAAEEINNIISSEKYRTFRNGDILKEFFGEDTEDTDSQN